MSCPSPVASAAPSMPMAGTGPKPKMNIGSRIMFATHPAIIADIDTFILPTDWNIFSKVTPAISITAKEKTITE